MIMRNIINPPLSSPPPSAKYRAYEEGWHRVFMYETYAREREKKNKQKVNQWMYMDEIYLDVFVVNSVLNHTNW